ncbi:hypothetical protein BH11VER1_BH11VER1_37040 [soil metagenome]
MTEFIDPEQEAKKDTRRAWRLMIVALALVFGLFAGVMLFYDCPPPDDSSIMPKFTESPGGHNPLAEFLEVVKAKPTGKEYYISDSCSPALFRARLRRFRDHVNAQTVPLEAFEKLMKSDLMTWRWPDRENMIPYELMGSVISTSVFFDASLLIKARVEAEDGKIDEALTTCLQLIRFGHAREGAQGAIIERSQASASVRAGKEALQDILALDNVNESTLAEIQQALAALEPSREDFMMTLKIEEHCVKKMIQALKTGEVGSMGSGMTPLGIEGLLLKPNLTLASKVYYVNPVLEGLKTGWKEGWLASQRMKRECDVRSRNWLLFRVDPNAYGNLHTQGTRSFIVHACEEALAEVTSTRQMVLMLALRRYELSEGKLPDSLEQLAPRYLPVVPLDPFDDAPMRWNPKTRVIYSIGEDAKDDGGKAKLELTYRVKTLSKRDLCMIYWWSEEMRAAQETLEKKSISSKSM